MHGGSAGEPVVVRWAAVDGVTDALAERLSGRERSRLASMARAADRQRFIGAHLLLRQVVAEVVGCDPLEVAVEQRCEECGGAHGRPTVRVPTGTGPQVSIAHAGGLALVAVADAAVGVDLEPDDAAPARLADVALSQGERTEIAAIAALDPVGAAGETLARWVRKEAVLKATGHGLSVDPALLELSPGPAARVRVWPGLGAPPAVTVTDLRAAPGYLAAVALVGDREPSVDASGVRLDLR